MNRNGRIIQVGVASFVDEWRTDCDAPGGYMDLDGPQIQRRAQARRPARPAPRPRQSHRPAFSRPGCELLGLPGLAWLREICWPVASAVLDGEAVAGDGSQGIRAVFEARNRSGSRMAFAAFDVLAVEGHSAMGEPWTARRKRLEDLLEFDGAMGREDHPCER